MPKPPQRPTDTRRDEDEPKATSDETSSDKVSSDKR
jgi:hypothetical protein